MKLLLDQDVFDVTMQFLRGLGHDVVPVAELGMSRADDDELLAVARTQSRIFVTRDRDFGGLVFVRGLGPGVLYLRTLPATLNAIHMELELVLKSYEEAELMRAFVVIEPGGHRIRRIVRN